VSDGCTLGIGGLHFHNTPMALVREVIRQQRRLGCLVPPIDGSINADQLIGAGLVEEVQVAFLGLELFGLAPRFRAAAEAGRLRVRDCDEAGFAFGLAAAAAGQPFASLPAGFLPESDDAPTVLSVNSHDYAVIEDPFTGVRHPVVRAIAPDVALVHCRFIDGRGNCGFLGGTHLDVELAKASRVCVIQAEEEVSELPSACRGHLPGSGCDRPRGCKRRRPRRR
jgi:glutaconate CoA-transferase subunit A